MDKIDKVDWALKWIALVTAVIACICIPYARIAWGCVSLWIISNMFSKRTIQNLEETRDILTKENYELYDEIEKMRKENNELKQKNGVNQ